MFINLFMPMTQISTWQRYSSGNEADVIKGFRQGIWQNILPLWYGVIAIAALVYLLSDQGTGFASLFDTLRTSNTLAAMFVFPLLFVGLVAALLSTADSMLIAIMLAINDARDGRGSYRQDESDDTEAIPSPSDKEVLSTGVAVILIALLVGGLLSISEDLDTTVTQLLFAGYGMPCLLFPIIAVDWIGAGITPKPKVIVRALWVGMAILWVGAVYGLVTGDFRGTHLGPVVGIAVVAVAVWLSRRRRRHRSDK